MADFGIHTGGIRFCCLWQTPGYNVKISYLGASYMVVNQINDRKKIGILTSCFS